MTRAGRSKIIDLPALFFYGIIVFYRAFSTMKIRLLSDLHHEWMRAADEKAQDYYEYRGEDVLVLAGDIASGSTNVFDTMKRFKKAGFPKIVYVPGNHEYYGTDIRTFDANIALKVSRDEDMHMLNPSWVEIGDTIFIGATLWTNFRGNFHSQLAAKAMISDFRLIDNFRPPQAELKYYEHVTYIRNCLKTFRGRKIVVVTHFLPAVECISERFRAGDNLLNHYFANDLGGEIAELENVTWLFGHTHDSCDFMLGNTRMVCNPYGYHNKEVNREFDPFKAIEV